MNAFSGHIYCDVEHRKNIEEKSCYAQRARCEWLLSKVKEMELTHSQLAVEAEQRVSTEPLSWSQMIFTDLFGPDIGILGDLTTRLSHIENNIKTFKKEALNLTNSLNIQP